MVCVGLNSEVRPWVGGPDENFYFAQWVETQKDKAKEGPEVYLSRAINSNFYLFDAQINRISIPKSKLAVNIVDTTSGGGKHSISTLVEQILIKRYGVTSILTEEMAQKSAAVQMKQEYRDQGKITSPFDRNSLGLSMLAEIFRIRALNENPQIKCAVSWRGTMSLFEDQIIADHPDELSDFMSSSPGLAESLYSSPSIKQIIDQFGHDLESGWNLLAKVIDDDMKTTSNPMLFWPFVELPIPIIALLDLSVEKCSELQDKPGKLRVDSRPYIRPFTQDQMIQMRLIKAIMVAKFPHMFICVGGYREDFENGGAAEIANDLLQKCEALHAQYCPMVIQSDIQRRGD